MNALLKYACNNRTFSYPKFVCAHIFVSLSSSSIATSFCLKTLLLFFSLFFRGEEYSVCLRHTWLPVSEKPCVCSCLESNYTSSSQRKPQIKQVMKLYREWKVFLTASFSDFNKLISEVFLLNIYIHMCILRFVRSAATLMSILCKIELIFSFLKLTCQITFNNFQHKVAWVTSVFPITDFHGYRNLASVHT